MLAILLGPLLAAASVYAQGTVSCPGAPTSQYQLNAAGGFRVGTVLARLSTPRGLAIDSAGNLLVVQRGVGLSAHTLDATGCVTSSKTIVSDGQLNHGIDVLGNKLYASSQNVVYSWDYNATAMTATNRKTLVTGMNQGTSTHVTRTVWISRSNPNLLVVSNGANNNIDTAAAQSSTGRAIVKVFDITTVPANGATYSSGGKVLGYGLRNDVGVTEGRDGVIYTVENSLDQAYRLVNGQRRDVHNDNPAEPFWKLDHPSSPSGTNYGYPYCFKVWEPSNFSDRTFQSGDWFVQEPSASRNDSSCATTAPRNPVALLPPHTAPLDVRFGVGSDHAAYVTLHGSWNRSPPQGYRVVRVAGSFSSSGAWTATAAWNSRTAFANILSNNNENNCVSGCFRPVGLAWSANGENLYVSSDVSGEVFIMKKSPSA